jgi:hypothetical protein
MNHKKHTKITVGAAARYIGDIISSTSNLQVKFILLLDTFQLLILLAGTLMYMNLQTKHPPVIIFIRAKVKLSL